MNESIKCPHCKGDKLQEGGRNEYKCMYCGTIFKTKEETTQENKSNTNNQAYLDESPIPPRIANPAPPVVNPIYIVNEPQKNNNDAFVKGVAGGCLGVAIWYFLGPVIGLLILMAMCSNTSI